MEAVNIKRGHLGRSASSDGRFEQFSVADKTDPFAGWVKGGIRGSHFGIGERAGFPGLQINQVEHARAGVFGYVETLNAINGAGGVGRDAIKRYPSRLPKQFGRERLFLGGGNIYQHHEEKKAKHEH